MILMPPTFLTSLRGILPWACPSILLFVRPLQKLSYSFERTSDGGDGNHSVSLPIILIKLKVNQILQSSCIS